MRFFYERLSIINRFLLIFVFFVLLPYICFSFVIFNTITNSMISNEYNKMHNELVLIKWSVERKLDEFEKKAVEIYNYRALFELFRKAKNQDYVLSTYDTIEINRNLGILCRSGDSSIDSIYFYMNNGSVYFYNRNNNPDIGEFYVQDMNIIKGIMENNGIPTWVPTFSVPQGRSASKSVYNIGCGLYIKDIYRTYEGIGCCIMNINISMFEELFKGIGLKDLNILIIDNEGRIIWDKYRNEMCGVLADGVLLENALSKERNDWEEESEGKIMSSLYSPINGWTYILSTDKSELYRTSTEVTRFLYIQIVFMLFFCVCAIIYIRYDICDPLRHIIVAMDKIKSGRFVNTEPPRHNNDEIGILFSSFNHMNLQIANLINNINIANELEKQQHIKALYAQINPHFLYNTLDTIYWMCEEINQSDISLLILSLSNILRYSISKNQTLVSLSDEISCIKNYLNIYEKRYEGNYQVDFDIDDSVLECQCFKMMLQPLVENVMVHAFCGLTRKGILKIRVKRSGDDVLIDIEDNGIGMSAERIHFSLISQNERIGISNINQLIKLQYGENYGLSIKSIVGAGTTVTIRIPYQVRGEGKVD